VTVSIRETAPLLYAALLAVFVWLAARVLGPFLPGITWAAVLVVTFRPLHDRVKAELGGRTWLASLLLTVLVALLVVVPVVIAAVRVTNGAIAAYQWTQTAYVEQGVDLGVRERWPWVADAIARVSELVGVAHVDVKATVLDLAKRVGSFAAAKAPGLLGEAFGLAFSFIVMLFMMASFFANGPVLRHWLASVLPIPRSDAIRILDELAIMTRSVFISVGLTALIQAALSTLGFLVLGVSNAFTLGAAVFFVAVLPGGPGFVWFPVAIYLAATGHPTKALILVAWGGGVVGTIDNFLRPYFARGGVKLPTTLLVFGLIGGAIAFGLVGLFLGPIVLYVVRELAAVTRREVYGEPVDDAGPPIPAAPAP
jgi:predicted PurR-regulated permease PerM